jgi:hypothetical protein
VSPLRRRHRRRARPSRRRVMRVLRHVLRQRWRHDGDGLRAASIASSSDVDVGARGDDNARLAAAIRVRRASIGDSCGGCGASCDCNCRWQGRRYIGAVDTAADVSTALVKGSGVVETAVTGALSKLRHLRHPREVTAVREVVLSTTRALKS